MKIVIDTNVMISAVFFGGKPGRILDAVRNGRVRAFASGEMIEEYRETLMEVAGKFPGRMNLKVFQTFVGHLEQVEPVNPVKVCRDPDDDKFISCALDAKALYIVSGDKDLLVLKQFGGVEMITPAEFCERFLV